MGNKNSKTELDYNDNLFADPPSDSKWGRYCSELNLKWLKDRIEQKWLNSNYDVYQFEDYVSQQIAESKLLHTKSLNVEFYESSTINPEGTDKSLGISYGMYLRVEFSVRGEDSDLYSYKFTAHLASANVPVQLSEIAKPLLQGRGGLVDRLKKCE